MAFRRPPQGAWPNARSTRNGHLKVQAFCVSISSAGHRKAFSVPESLVLHFLPRSNLVGLEINGRLIHSSSSAFVTLHRSRIEEKHSAGRCYVSSDDIRVYCDLSFELYLRDEVLICGSLEKSTKIGEDLSPLTKWGMQCRSKLQNSSKWIRSIHPVADVSLSGKASGIFWTLEQTVELVARKKPVWSVALDTIPEGSEDAESCCSYSESEVLYDLGSFKRSNWICSGSNGTSGDRKNDEMLAEEGTECSWLSCGRKYGLGIGLGICLCLSASLLFANSKPLKKRLVTP